jgi:hypothetical protein
MRFEYVLQRRDQAEALRATFPGDSPPPAGDAGARRVTPGARHWLAAVVLVLGIVLLLQFGPAVAAASGYCPKAVVDGRGDGRVFTAGAAAGGAGLLLCAVTVLCLTRAKSSETPVNPSPAMVDLGDEGLTLTETGKEFALTWEGVVAFAETQNLFVLKTMGGLRVALPKRARAGDDVARLRETIQSKVAPLASVAAAAGGATS